MDILKINNMPDHTTTIATDILNFLTTLVPYGAVVAMFWKGIDAVFKYASEGRDERTMKLIKGETAPLSDEIKELTKSIWALSKKIEEKG